MQLRGVRCAEHGASRSTQHCRLAIHFPQGLEEDKAGARLKLLLAAAAQELHQLHIDFAMGTGLSVVEALPNPPSFSSLTRLQLRNTGNCQAEAAAQWLQQLGHLRSLQALDVDINITHEYNNTPNRLVLPPLSSLTRLRLKLGGLDHSLVLCPPALPSLHSLVSWTAPLCCAAAAHTQQVQEGCLALACLLCAALCCGSCHLWYGCPFSTQQNRCLGTCQPIGFE